MTDYEQAVKDVGETLDGIQDKYVPARLRPMYRYAVAQREARLRLEYLAREAIKAAGCDDQCTGLDNCHLYDLRAALEAGKELPNSLH